MKTAKNVWCRIIKKSKEEVLIKIEGAIRSFSWDEFNAMFIMHPLKTNFAKLREIQKQHIADDMNDMFCKMMSGIEQEGFDMDPARQALLAAYITELERKLKCSRQDVKVLIRKRMDELLNKEL